MSVKKSIILLFIALMIVSMITGCSISKDDVSQPEWISPADSIDRSGMNIYYRSEDIQFAADSEAMISLYVAAGKNSDGVFGFDDGQDWLLVMETSLGDYPLFPRQYVQIGMVSYTIFNEWGDDAWDIFHVLVTVDQGAGYKIYDCIFDGDKKAFQIIPVYDASNINNSRGSR